MCCKVGLCDSGCKGVIGNKGKVEKECGCDIPAYGCF
jgi:hypothetical protein